MYSESVDFYDQLYSFKDYPKEADVLTDMIKAKLPSARTLLDVACGTGRHLQHLKTRFQVEGIDVSPRFMAFAQKNNPEIPFHVGDMLDFSLPKRFDVITCLFSSIGYVRTAARLARAISNMSSHLTRNGLLVIEPWFPPEAWHADTAHATFVDEPELKIARMSTSKTNGSLSVMEMHYLVSTPESTRHFIELHEMGLFTQHEMMNAFHAAGLDTIYHPEGLTKRGLYLGTLR